MNKFFGNNAICPGCGAQRTGRFCDNCGGCISMSPSPESLRYNDEFVKARAQIGGKFIGQRRDAMNRPSLFDQGVATMTKRRTGKVKPLSNAAKVAMGIMCLFVARGR